MHKRQVQVGDVVYASIAAAAAALDTDPYTLRNRLVSKNPKWAHLTYVDQPKVSKIIRTKRVQVCFKGVLYPSIQIAARTLQMSAPNVAHHLNSHNHPDCYYLLPDGSQVKHPEKCVWRASQQTRARAIAATQQRRLKAAQAGATL